MAVHKICFAELPADVQKFILQDLLRKGKDNRQQTISKRFERMVRRISEYLAASRS